MIELLKQFREWIYTLPFVIQILICYLIFPVTPAILMVLSGILADNMEDDEGGRWSD